MTKRQKSSPTPVRGRPQIEFTEEDWRTFAKMAADGCTQQEMADYKGCSVSTFRATHVKERFEAITKRAWAATRWKVRQRQLKKALEGQPVASIWWGKQHLGQKDKHEHTGANNGPLEVIAGAEERLIQLVDKLARKKEKP